MASSEQHIGMFTSPAAIYGGTFTMNVQPPTVGFDILSRVASPSAAYNAGHLYDRPKCHLNTRVTILNKIQKWILADLDDQPPRILWLHGAAGAGKTAIAHSISEWCDDQNLLLATFFFWRSDQTRNNIISFVSTLAYAICKTVPPSRQSITAVIANDPHVFSQRLDVQFSKLIIDILEPLSNSFRLPYVIIIDGLDECNDPEEQKVLLQLVEYAVQHCKFGLKVLISSRPERLIRSTFENTALWDLSTRLALNHDYHADEDIRRFLEDKFEKIKSTHPRKSFLPINWPSSNEITKLVGKSSGQFIYAKTVVKYISSDYHSPIQRLKSILDVGAVDADPRQGLPLAELDALYTHIISSTRVANAETTCCLVASCVFLKEKYTLKDYAQKDSEVVAEMLNMDHEEICSILAELGSLVDFDADIGSFQILHASLGDFLFDTCRSGSLFVDRRKVNADLACYYLHRLENQWPWHRYLDVITDILQPSTVIVTPKLVKCLAEVDLLYIVKSRSTRAKFAESAEHYASIIFDLLNVFKDLALGHENGIAMYQWHLAIFDQWLVARLRDYSQKSLGLQILAMVFSIPSKFARQFVSSEEQQYDLNHLHLLTLYNQENIWPMIMLLDLPKSQSFVMDGQVNAMAALQIIKNIISSAPISTTKSNDMLDVLPVLLGRADKLSELIHILPSSTITILSKYRPGFPVVVDEWWHSLKAAVRSYLERHGIPISEINTVLLSFLQKPDMTMETLHFDQAWNQEGVAISTWNEFVSCIQCEPLLPLSS